MIHTVTTVYVERHGKIQPLLGPDGVPVKHYVSSPDLATLRELLRNHLGPEIQCESVLFVSHQTSPVAA